MSKFNVVLNFKFNSLEKPNNAYNITHLLKYAT